MHPSREACAVDSTGGQAGRIYAHDLVGSYSSATDTNASAKPDNYTDTDPNGNFSTRPDPSEYTRAMEQLPRTPYQVIPTNPCTSANVL